MYVYSLQQSMNVNKHEELFSSELQIPQDRYLQPGQAEKQEITSMCMDPSEETLAITTDQGQIYHVNFKLSVISRVRQQQGV